MKANPRTPLAPTVLLVAAALCYHHPAGAAGPGGSGDRVGRHLFPPELILVHQEEIGLGDGQREAIEAEFARIQSLFPEKQRALQEANDALAEVFESGGGAGAVEEAEVLAALDAVLRREQEVKRLHFAVLVRIRNQLTPAQRGQLAQLRARMEQAEAGGRPPNDPPARIRKIQAGLEKIKAGVEEWAASARDPSAIAARMEPFAELMSKGRFAEAEALIAEVLQALAEPEL